MRHPTVMHSTSKAIFPSILTLPYRLPAHPAVSKCAHLYMIGKRGHIVGRFRSGSAATNFDRSAPAPCKRPVGAARRRKGSWKLNRRFIVVEGIYANTGDVAPLAAIAALKRKCASWHYQRSSMPLVVLATSVLESRFG